MATVTPRSVITTCLIIIAMQNIFRAICSYLEKELGNIEVKCFFKIIHNYHMELILTMDNFIQSLIIFAWIIRITSYLLSVTYV